MKQELYIEHLKNIAVLPETIKTLYDEADTHFAYWTERYSQDSSYFDRIYKATQYILNEEYEKAQNALENWQKDLIEHSGKKSMFYKYKNI